LPHEARDPILIGPGRAGGDRGQLRYRNAAILDDDGLALTDVVEKGAQAIFASVTLDGGAWALRPAALQSSRAGPHRPHVELEALEVVARAATGEKHDQLVSSSSRVGTRQLLNPANTSAFTRPIHEVAYPAQTPVLFPVATHQL
jgi:hypothetical protein